MTEPEYYAAVRAFGLRASRFAETFFTVNGEAVSVPLARDLTPEARRETIDRLRGRLGVEP